MHVLINGIMKLINLRTDLDGFTSEGKHPNNFLFVFYFVYYFLAKFVY